MNMEYIITRDINEFAPILKPLVSDFGYVFYSTILEWCKIIEDYNNIFWDFRLIKMDGLPIGCCGLYSFNYETEELWLAWFGIIPEYRNNGLGSDVLKFLEEEAKNLNCKRILSYVDKGGAPLNFYKRNGYEIIGTVKDYLEANKLKCIDGSDFEDMEDYVIRKEL